MDVSVVSYATQMAVLSIALGLIALRLPGMLRIPAASRFLVGFCSTPSAIGLWLVLLAAVIPGGPVWLFAGSPLVVGLVILVVQIPWVRLRIGKRQWTVPRAHRRPLGLLIWAVAGLTMLILLGRLLTYVRYPIIGHDALVYLGQALRFAGDRSGATVIDFHGLPDGTLQGSEHGFGYSAFLSQALLAGQGVTLGYPNDQTARFALQITFVYMILSMLALVLASTRWTSAGLAIPLVLQVPQFQFVALDSSRDPFRIVPLLLLATVLIGLSPKGPLRPRPLELLPVVAMAALSLTAHTLNGVAVVMIGASWIGWSAMGGARRLNLLLVAGALGLGLAVGGVNYARAYLETGHLWGLIHTRYAVEGTPLSQVIADSQRVGAVYAVSLWERLTEFFARDGYRLSLPALAAVAIILGGWRKGGAGGPPSAQFLALATLSNLVPITGLLDFGEYRLSAWFAENFRYALHWYPFGAALLTVVVGEWFLASDRLGKARAALRNGILVGVVVMVGISSTGALGAWQSPTWTDEWVEKQVGPLLSMARELPGRRLLLEDSRYNYYLSGQAVIMYTPATWNIVRARNDEELDRALKAAGIGSMVLENGSLNGWWNKIPLYAYLKYRRNAYVSQVTDRYTAYVVGKEAVQEWARLAEASLEAHTRENLLLRLDFSTLTTEGGKGYVTATSGQRVLIEGAASLTEGPDIASKGLVIDASTRLALPASAIDLRAGTFSIWAKLADPGKEVSVLLRVNGNQDLYIDHRGASGKFVAEYNGTQLGTTTLRVTDDNWHHYVLTWDDGEQDFYIDGELGLSGQVAGSDSATTEVALGWPASDFNEWNGGFASLSAFDRPLSPTEVRALYQRHNK